ncbi:MAG: hypothetical protein EG826_02410 [Deltaproteobacteria bacterium]|nr:hypothetical protein [Deltaproteobacteria bacterium]
MNSLRPSGYFGQGCGEVNGKSEAGRLSRRQLIQAGALAGAWLALPGRAACSPLPAYKKLASGDDAGLYLIHGNVIDVVRGVVLRDKTVVIRRGLIADVADTPALTDPQAAVVDLRNHYVLPGLIDAHCHTTLTSEAGLSVLGLAATYRQLKRNYVQQFAHGVTTVRDMGAMPKLLRDGLKWIADGDITGPRVVYCNAFTNIFESHPDIDPAAVSIFSGLALAVTGNPSLWFKDTRELQDRMRENSAGGAAFIKLTLDRRSVMCGRGEIPVYSDEHLRTIKEFAQMHNLPTAGHVHTRFGFARALRYSLNSIEHSIGDAAVTDQDALAMAQKNIAIVPTLMIAQMYAAPEAYRELPAQYRTDFIGAELAIRQAYLQSCTDDDVEPVIHQTNLQTLELLRAEGCEALSKKGKFLARPDLYFDILLQGPENLLRMKRGGVLVGCGTDSGVPFIYHGTLWREMEMLRRLGLTNSEVLQCATINNARILRLADKIGTVEKGKFADLAVFRENPLEKIEACRRPRWVVKEGRVYDVSIKM